MNTPANIKDLRKLPVRFLREALRAHRIANPGFYGSLPKRRVDLHLAMTDSNGHVLPGLRKFLAF